MSGEKFSPEVSESEKQKERIVRKLAAAQALAEPLNIVIPAFLSDSPRRCRTEIGRIKAALHEDLNSEKTIALLGAQNNKIANSFSKKRMIWIFQDSLKKADKLDPKDAGLLDSYNKNEEEIKLLKTRSKRQRDQLVKELIIGVLQLAEELIDEYLKIRGAESGEQTSFSLSPELPKH